VNLSNVHFHPDLAYWQDFLPFLDRLPEPGFPSCSQLNALLPHGLISAGGHSIRFVDSDQLADDAYEQLIYTTGQVSTRPDSWHDLFNALIWMRYPRIKTAMNKLHYQAGAGLKSGSRGELRDALTLFDECGVIVFSDRLEILTALAERRWSDAFHSVDFRTSVGLSVSGHAMLEKYLLPYKAMTAKALLFHVDTGFMKLSRPEMIDLLDREIANQFLSRQVLIKPACLSPLPLAGVPGWWPRDEQEDDMFYCDPQVFRPAPSGLNPVPVLKFTKDQPG
jgi:hypothetical protein